jgi:hypothetical protein
LEKNESRLLSLFHNVLTIVICLIVWPVFALFGGLILLMGLSSYFKSIWNQRKILSVLRNDNSLKEYAGKRIKACEAYIKVLQKETISFMKTLRKPDELGLPIPKKWCFLSKIPEEAWTDFPWNDFLNTEIFQKVSNDPNNLDKFDLKYLEEIRTRYKHLEHQKHFLSNSEINLEDIKRIAELSFVKNAFYRQESKKMMVASIYMFIPWGLCLFRASDVNARSAYEGKKDLLPSISNFEKYTDLVDAHNQLIEKNDFLVPLITPPGGY